MDGLSVPTELLCSGKEIYCENQLSNHILRPTGKYQNLKVSTDIFSECNVYEVIIDDKKSSEEETWKVAASYIFNNVIKRVRKSFSTWEFYLDGIKYKPPDEGREDLADKTTIGDLLQISYNITEEDPCLISPHCNEKLDFLKKDNRHWIAKQEATLHILYGIWTF